MRLDYLKGYKTYVVAVLSVLGAVGSLLTGETSLADAIQIVVTAVMGATIRAGIKNDTNQ